MLNWLKAAFGRGARGLSLVSPWLRSITWAVKREFLELAREGYSKNAVVYACVQLLAQSIPEPPLLAYQVDEKFQRVQVPFDHSLQRLIRAPNSEMTEYEMMELIEVQLDIAGRSYWWKRRNNLGEVIALIPLRPDRVGVQYGDSQQILEGFNYFTPGTEQPQFIARRDMIALTLPDPAGETGGIVESLGPLQVLAREVETDNEATAFVAALLKNSATPGGLLRVKQAISSKAALERIKERFMSQFGGAKRGEPMVLDADTEYETIGFNLQQLEFPNLRHVSESRIAAAFRVPSILVGLKVGLDAGIRATIQDQRKSFTETTLKTRWRRISDAFTSQLAPDFGENLVLRFDLKQVTALAEQSRFEVQPIKEGFAAGAVTIDEYRTHVLNLPGLPEGQGAFVYVPVSYVPVPIDGDSTQSEYSLARDGDDFTGRDHPGDYTPGDGEFNHPPGVPGQAAAKGDMGVPHPHAGRARGTVINQRGRPHPHRGHPGSLSYAARPGTGGQPAAADPGEQKQRRRKRARTAHNERVQRHGERGLDKLALALNMMGMALAARAEQRATPAPGKAWQIEDRDLATNQERATLHRIVHDIWLGALHDAHREAADLLTTPLPVDLKTPATKALLALVDGRVDMLLHTTAKAVQDGLAADHDHRHALREQLETLGVFGASRAARIVSNEAAVASNLASLLAYKAAGVGYVEVMDEHDGACPECKAAHGNVWTIEYAATHHTEHPGCRRTFVPVAEEEAEQEVMAAD